MRPALVAASAAVAAASGVPVVETSAVEVSAVPEGVFGWATEAGSQGPEVAPPAAGWAVPGSIE